MKFSNKKKVLVSSAMVAGMLLTTFSVSNVHAADTDNSNASTNATQTAIPDKSLIAPVASRGSQTLRQVAKDNNASLDTLEKLNNNMNPDEVIPDGTMLYLPGNVDYSMLFGVYATSSYNSHLSARERAAKAWIARHESGGSYVARNGRNYGKYQLDIGYLHGDYSPANQERTADRYVKGRYGSWVNAKKFWLAHHWY